MEPYKMIQSHTGRYGAIQEDMEPYRIIGSHTGGKEALLDDMDNRDKTIWIHIE